MTGVGGVITDPDGRRFARARDLSHNTYSETNRGRRGATPVWKRPGPSGRGICSKENGILKSEVGPYAGSGALSEVDFERMAAFVPLDHRRFQKP